MRCAMCGKILNENNIGIAINRDGVVKALCKKCKYDLNAHRITRQRKREALWIKLV